MGIVFSIYRKFLLDSTLIIIASLCRYSMLSYVEEGRKKRIKEEVFILEEAKNQTDFAIKKKENKEDCKEIVFPSLSPR